MELVAAVFVVVGAVIAVSVCARRATLGDEMDRSFGVLNSAPVQTLHGSTVKNPESVPEVRAPPGDTRREERGREPHSHRTGAGAGSAGLLRLGRGVLGRCSVI